MFKTHDEMDAHFREAFTDPVEKVPYKVPSDIRSAAEQIIMAYGIRGISDPMYVANVIAKHTGRGDGQSTFYEMVPERYLPTTHPEFREPVHALRYTRDNYRSLMFALGRRSEIDPDRPVPDPLPSIPFDNGQRYINLHEEMWLTVGERTGELIVWSHDNFEAFWKKADS